MLVAREIVGSLDEPRWTGRSVERLPVDWTQASKRRMRGTTDRGTDVAVDLPHGTYLADGAVLYDDGERLIAVARRPEPALVIRFDPNQSHASLVSQVARIGHAFGNQHVPLEASDGALRVPITTSEAVARETVAGLGLEHVSVSVETVTLASSLPFSDAPGQHHRHSDGA